MDNEYGIQIEIDESFMTLVDAKDLTTAAQSVLMAEDAPAVELMLVITDDEAMRELNRTYRGVDAPTDVLSFSSQEVADSDEPSLTFPPELAAMLNTHLGDIVIAYPYAARQSSRFGNSIAAELRLLTVHGALHLLGYDHDTPEAEAEMWARQEDILRTFGDQALARREYSD